MRLFGEEPRREIAEAVGDRAEYGRKLLQFLSENLTAEFGKGFTVRNLQNMRQFYQITHALCAELTWSHYRMLMRVEEPSRREFYLTESADQGWTTRQLERQINSFYYERLLATKKEHRPEVMDEIRLALFFRRRADNPTIGLVLVTDKDESIAKYSVLADNEHLFASKYRLYLPTEEELRIELQRERTY